MNDTIKAFLSARATQLLTRLLGAVLVGKLGYDAAHAATTISVVSELAVAGAMFGVDLVIHEVQKRVAAKK